MMIVTHEMQFAREVSNRVFYMDEGIIYEEGTPEEIFEHPEKEKTIHFMRRLKVLEIDITTHSFDFADAVARIDQYCYKNRILPKVSSKLQSVFEELCIQILMPALKDPAIHITIVYDRAQEAAEMTAEYPGDYRVEEAEQSLAYTVLTAESESVIQETLPDKSRSIVRVRIRS